MAEPNVRDESADEQEFRAWKAHVNAAVRARIGLDADDLPDVDYWSMWSSGTTPKAAAARALRNARE
jgi:hypothetical protein